MRTILVLVLLIAAVASKAQSSVPVSFNDYTQLQALTANMHPGDSASNKKWFLSKYSGISTSFSFFKGGNATVVSAPLGLQLNRRLNNNLYAFAGISVAPAYINFNSSFLSSNTNKAFQNNTGFRSGSFDMYSRAEMGLMYVNDKRTFSISGSIGIERSTYPLFPYNQPNTIRTNPVCVPNR
ncbi:hypothetical protein BH11BAC6_BH11BAC6_17870 [soil metagenome]